MALFQGIQEYIALNANNIAHPILYKDSVLRSASAKDRESLW